MQPAPTPCADLAVLKTRLRADLAVYLDQAAKLNVDTLPVSFNAAYARTEYSRLAFEFSRERLNAHIATHGCVDVQV